MFSPKILLIVNPKAGRYRPARIAVFVDILHRHGAQVEVVYTERRGHGSVLAQDAVKEGCFTHIVAAGGDGTIAEVAESLLSSRCILGVLPVGTANVFAHEMKVPFSYKENADILVGRKFVIVWTGIVEKKYESNIFIQMLGAGFDAYVVRNVSKKIKFFFGRFSYILSIIKSLFCYKASAFEVIIDNVIYKNVFSLIVSKGSFYAGNYKLVPESCQDKRDFSVLLFHSFKKKFILRMALSLLTGRLVDQKEVTYLQGRKICVKKAESLSLQTDGDFAGEGAFSATISQKPLRVAVV